MTVLKAHRVPLHPRLFVIIIHEYKWRRIIDTTVTLMLISPPAIVHGAVEMNPGVRPQLELI